MLAVYDAARRAAADGRAGRGPVFLELLTYRRTGHSRRDPCHYQPKEEREAWFSRDPIDRFAARLQERGDVSAADLEAVNTRVQATAGGRGEGPACPTAHALGFGDGCPGLTKRRIEPMKRLGIAEALREAIAEEMERDPRVFCLGEDIGVPGGWGGAFTVTLGWKSVPRAYH